MRGGGRLLNRQLFGSANPAKRCDSSRLGGVRDSQAGRIWDGGHDLTASQDGIRVDFAGEGDQRQYENDDQGSHETDFCQRLRLNRSDL